MRFRHYFIATVLMVFCSMTAVGQTTSFMYQGLLNVQGVPANGQYDIEFALFDGPSQSATQIGPVQTSGAIITNGLFSIDVNFGDQFPGADRWLQLRVRLNGTTEYTTLPRQQIRSSPYSITSINAQNANALGGVPADQYVTTASGSTNFVRNTTTQQASSNFNISGLGKAGVLEANTYNIRGFEFVGIGGFGNASIKVGINAGGNIDNGFQNTFLGYRAGASNSTGGSNVFAGANAGFFHTTGSSNSLFGWSAGTRIVTSSRNSMFGYQAGNNTIADDNAFFGSDSGVTNTAGSGNSLFGTNSDVASGQLVNSTAIGFRSYVAQSNSLVLGSINGVNGATSNTNVGIGTTSPQFRLHVVGENVRVEGNATGVFPRFSLNFTGGAADAKKWQNYAAANALAFTAINDAETQESAWMIVRRGTGTAINSIEMPSGGLFIGLASSPDKLAVNGTISFAGLGAAGGTALCRNAQNQIAFCSSSARYKHDIAGFRSGLSLIRQLRPVSFAWNGSNTPDLGLVAEDVAAVEPLLTTTNDKGEVEGVKYDRVGVVLINAVNEQQALIESQQKQIDEQKREIEQLRQLICRLAGGSDICKPKN